MGRGLFERGPLRKWTLVSLIIVVPICSYTKFYRGPAAAWVNDSLVGVFYEIFWCLIILLFLPKVKPWIVALCVLIVTCILEFMQLWHPPFLELLRSNFIGRTLLGTTFTWTDFPYYFLGSGIGWFWIRHLQTLENC
jgi:hypothetical protein